MCNTVYQIRKDLKTSPYRQFFKKTFRLNLQNIYVGACILKSLITTHFFNRKKIFYTCLSSCCLLRNSLLDCAPTKINQEPLLFSWIFVFNMWKTGQLSNDSKNYKAWDKFSLTSAHSCSWCYNSFNWQIVTLSL